MTLLECLTDPRVLSGELWFRPVGDMYAYAVDCWRCGELRGDPEIKRVPTARGGESWLTNQVALLTGEWEIVSPDVVNDGLASISAR